MISIAVNVGEKLGFQVFWTFCETKQNPRLLDARADSSNWKVMKCVIPVST